MQIILKGLSKRLIHARVSDRQEVMGSNLTKTENFKKMEKREELCELTQVDLN